MFLPVMAAGWAGALLALTARVLNDPGRGVTSTLVLCVATGLCLVAARDIASLKRVRLSQRDLLIASPWTEAAVPLSRVSGVAHGARGDWVTVTFSATTPFGRRIHFMPPQRPFPHLGLEHPVARELRRVARRAAARASVTRG